MTTPIARTIALALKTIQYLCVGVWLEIVLLMGVRKEVNLFITDVCGIVRHVNYQNRI